MKLARRVDAWLFADGSARHLAALRAGLGVVIVLRIASWPFAELAGSPPALFRPPLFLAWARGMPPAAVLIGLQVAGVAGGLAAVAGSWSGRRAAVSGLRLAWVALLFLAGFKTSTGKVLHNDVLLLLAAVPAVLCGTPARLRSPQTGTAFGWPLRAGMVAISMVYAITGLQKLRHSGPAWVFSDNMRWILDEAVRSGRAPTTTVASLILGSAALSTASAFGLLAFELAFPLALVVRRARLPLAVGAVALHSLTWLTLGLDYWAWSLVVMLILGLSSVRVVGRGVQSGVNTTALR